MMLRLRDRVETQGYLSGPYKLFWHVLEKADTIYTVSVLAIPVVELDPIVNSLKEVAQAKIRGLFFLPILIAQQVLKEENIPEKDQPMIVLYREKEAIWLTLCEKGILHYVERIPIDEMLGINFDILANRINVYQSLFRADKGKEVKAIVTYSPEILEGLKSLNLEGILIDSETSLYLTALQLKGDFNLLSEEERAIIKLMEINVKTAYVMYAISTILLLGTVVCWLWNKNLEKEIKIKENMLVESINSLLAHYPAEKIKYFQNYIIRKRELESYPSPSEILLRTLELDENIIINEFQVIKSGNDYQITIGFTRKASPQELSYVVQRLTEKINAYIDVRNSLTNYDTANHTLKVQINGIIKRR